MKVALITPWDNAWVPYFRQSIESRGHQFSLLKAGKEWAHPADFDVVLHGWAGGSPLLEGARNVVFLRRFELFDNRLERVDWPKVHGLICVNSWIRDVVKGVFEENGVKTPIHLVYNGTDPSRWRFKERSHGKRIGMACHIHPKKNLPLAVQILSVLPEDYSLHIAGEIQDTCTAEYLNHVGKLLRRRIYIYGHIPAEQLSLWWEQMNYCLSTSISEGNPNNVIESMAKGIKPIVHNWPGAEDQFPEDVRFSTVEEAAKRISEPYESKRYRSIVEEKFSLANIDRAVDIALAA